jgi:rubrerythrin
VRATRRQALAAAGASLLLPATALADAQHDQAKATLSATLKLEQTALVAYEAIANSGALKDVLRQFLDQERQHAAQLVAALQNLGAKPPIPPRRAGIAGLDAAVKSRDAALRFAIALESRSIAAYQAAIAATVDSNVVHTNAGAMGTDAQQLVILRELAGIDPVPRAFETGA